MGDLVLPKPVRQPMPRPSARQSVIVIAWSSLLVLGAGFSSAGPVAAGASAQTPTSSANALGGPLSVGTPAVVPPGAADVGAASPKTSLHVEIALKLRDPAALDQFLTALSDPSSPLYRHYLSKGQFDPMFGPTRATVAKVRAQLRHAGLKVAPLAGDDLVLGATTTVAGAEKAFGVRMDSYRLASGALVAANATAPTLPAAIAPFVLSVVGLDGLVQPTPAGLGTSSGGAPPARGGGSPGIKPDLVQGAKPDLVTGQPAACTAAVNTNDLTADDIAQAYDFAPLYSIGDFGAGENVGLVETSSYSASDVAAYQACYGTHVNVVPVPEGGGNSTPSSEADIDIEDVVGLAPGLSNVLVYEAPDNFGGILADLVGIAHDDAAKVVSTSTNGGCESVVGTSNALSEEVQFQKMYTQGQTMFAASGDNGSEDCWRSVAAPTQTQLAVSDPASQPFVTAVGGTDLTGDGNPPVVAPSETAWIGSGGGISSIWIIPYWQTGNGVISPSSSGAPCGKEPAYCREVPDVSLNAGADYAMYLGRWTRAWGTSLAAPTWAAMTALIDDSSASCRKAPVGWINPELYQLATSTPADFNDITTGNNNGGAKVHPGDYDATPGYDMATGLGSPEAANLAQSFCGVTLWTPPATSSPNFYLTESPSLASSGRTLYAVGTDGYPVSSPSDIYLESYDGTTWSYVGTVNPGGAAALTTSPPSITVNNGDPIVAWTAVTTGDVEVSTLSGGSWSSPVVIGAGTAQSDAGPTIRAYGGELYAAWKDMSSDNVYLSIDNGNGWSAPIQVTGASSQARPTLVFYPTFDAVVVAWTTSGDDIQYAAYSPLTFGWGPVQTISSGSSAGPALAVVGTTLYAAWAGTTSYAVYYSSLPPGKLSGTWSAPQAVPRAGTLVSPALAVIGPTLFAGWTGQNNGGTSVYMWFSASDAPQ